ncbi:hypothetical protein [Inquilinus limosus]|uniref:Uncharacterized protein n=1 Tax=Inquilinus limosus MP06 TaxID=1398085 RepID=A0A0A0D0S9_9PROT|nr:hypothetical protein [Inquilinus limosus]KGM31634.1 hypothetical protein P409_26015 [Inquilinus limosus MP06]
MPSLSAETPRLTLQQIDAYELIPRPKRMARAPSFDYGTGPDQNRYFSRAQTMGNVAGLMLQGMEYLNEKGLGHALKIWLRNNEPAIIANLQAQGAKAFVVCMTYWTWIEGGTATRVYEYNGAYILGYAASARPDDIGKVLTPEMVYGPKASPIRSGATFADTYLIGQARAL